MGCLINATNLVILLVIEVFILFIYKKISAAIFSVFYCIAYQHFASGLQHRRLMMCDCLKKRAHNYLFFYIDIEDG